MKKRNTSVLVTLGLLLMSGVASAEIAVIANPGVGVSSLDANQVKRIFLGKSSSLPDGSKAELADQKEGDAIREQFYEKVVGKNASQMKAYWSKLIFSGKGVPPTVVGDDVEIKAWVSKTPGGIGYIDAGSADGSVKVLFTLK